MYSAALVGEAKKSPSPRRFIERKEHKKVKKGTKPERKGSFLTSISHGFHRHGSTMEVRNITNESSTCFKLVLGAPGEEGKSLWCRPDELQQKFYTEAHETIPCFMIQNELITKPYCPENDQHTLLLHTTTETFECFLESAEQRNIWFQTLSVTTLATKDPEHPLVKQKKKHNTVGKEYQRVKDLIEQTGSSKVPNRYYETRRKGMDSIADSFSSSIDTSLFEMKGVVCYSLISGTFEDIIKWCIMHCRKSKLWNIDAASLFLCYNWIMPTDEFCDIIKSTWEEWTKKKKFPSSFPTNMPERFLNFCHQFLESPIITLDYEKEVQCRKELCRLFSGKSLERMKSAKIPLIKDPIPPQGNVRLNGDIVTENAISFPVEELAAQLTFDDSKFFAQANSYEYVNHNWQNPYSALCIMTERYNKLCDWASWCVVNTIIVKEQKKCYKKLLCLSLELHELQNYFSASAILNGITLPAVKRLALAAELSEKLVQKIEFLQEAYSPLGRSKKYRELPQTPTCIPLLDVHIRDFTVALDYLDTFKKENVINFSKMRQTGDVVLGLLDINRTFYLTNLPTRSIVKRHLSRLDPPSRDVIYEYSTLIRPIKSSAKDIREHCAELKQENAKLFGQLSSLKEELDSHEEMKFNVQEAIQGDTSGASFVQSLKSEDLNEEEQILLLQTYLRATLDLIEPQLVKQ